MTAEDAEYAQRHIDVCAASVKGWTERANYRDFFRRILATYHALAIKTERYDEIHREWESACERERAANHLLAEQSAPPVPVGVEERDVQALRNYAKRLFERHLPPIGGECLCAICVVGRVLGGLAAAPKLPKKMTMADGATITFTATDDE